MSITFYLDDYLVKTGMSFDEVADIVEMSYKDQRDYEKNKMRSINVSTLNKLCKLFDCNVGDLLMYFPEEYNYEEGFRVRSEEFLNY